MFKRSNSVDLFTNKVMDYMTDDYVLVDKEQTVKSSIEKLRTDLDENSRKMQLQRKAEEADAMKSTLEQVPLPIFIA